jgi:hypothetical protein
MKRETYKRRRKICYLRWQQYFQLLLEDELQTPDEIEEGNESENTE